LASTITIEMWCSENIRLPICDYISSRIGTHRLPLTGRLV
jgi:hypothetical protein